MSDTPRTDAAVEGTVWLLCRQLERALSKCVAVLSGEEMSKNALIDALKAARDVLKP